MKITGSQTDVTLWFDGDVTDELSDQLFAHGAKSVTQMFAYAMWEDTTIEQATEKARAAIEACES